MFFGSFFDEFVEKENKTRETSENGEKGENDALAHDKTHIAADGEAHENEHK